jgi:hypothetical protein
VSLNDDRSPLLDMMNCIVCDQAMKLEKVDPDDQGDDIMTPTACEDEDRELRCQAILGMAHYRSARAFAVNPASLKARPLRAAGIDRSARPSKECPSCRGWKEAPR